MISNRVHNEGASHSDIRVLFAGLFQSVVGDRIHNGKQGIRHFLHRTTDK